MGILKLVNGVRNAASLSPSLASSTSMLTSTTPEGLRLACIPDPSPQTPISRVSVAFNAGSRRETLAEYHGLSHLFQRSFGLSTYDHTAVNLTRHLQQMGARVTCTSTRESFICSIDVAPNILPRASALLAEMATKTAYYHWELKSTAYRLMQKDIELLNRRNLPALTMELLHEAAFGKNPNGSGLGSSLVAPADRIGTYSIEQIELFLSQFFTPRNCSISLLGCDSSEEGMDLLDCAKDSMLFRALQKPPEKTGKVHGFVGGDVRRALSAATYVYANFAWPTHGRICPLRPAYDLLACLLTGPVNHVSYSGRGSKIFGEDALVTEGVQVAPFVKVYSDQGLFGISLCSVDAKAMGERLAHIIAALRTSKFTEEDLARAKLKYKADLAMEFENPLKLGTDLAVQLCEPEGKYQSPSDRATSVDNVSLAQLNEALTKAVTSPHAALAVVGLNAYDVLPLNALLSS